MQDERHFACADLNRREVLKAAGAGLAASVLPNAPARADETVELLLWSWLPNFQSEVDLFQAAHPNIKVKLVNAGQGADEYTKLRAGLKAGSGLPDVCHIEFQLVRSFRQLNALADIGEWANPHKGEFAPWSWNQVSDGDKVYSMPWDSGPIAVLYRKDIFDKYNIAIPKTWDEFAEQAIKLHQAAPDVYLTDATFSDGGWVNSVLWQAGWRPFEVNGAEIRIQVNGEIPKKFAAYWQKLIDAKAIEAKPGFVTEWYTSLDQGRYATWITAGWGPVFLASFAKTSAGKWRAAPIPQWQTGTFVSANWGGSTLAVLSSTRRLKEAAELAIWLTTNPQATSLYTTKQFLFPVVNALLDSPEFANKPFDFYGGQPVNQVFIESAKAVDPSFQWSPFQDYVNQTMGDELGAAASGKRTLAEAFDRLQDNFVRYAQDQGFTVKT